jgi:hypothetical protein
MFPVRYKLNIHILFTRDSFFKRFHVNYNRLSGTHGYRLTYAYDESRNLLHCTIVFRRICPMKEQLIHGNLETRTQQ